MIFPVLHNRPVRVPQKKNCASPGGSGPHVVPEFYASSRSKRHLDRFSRFGTDHGYDHTQTTLHSAIARIYAPRTCDAT